MIDQSLIEQSMLHIRASFFRMESKSSNLWRMQDVFPPELIEKLKTYISQVPESKWSKVEYQESMPRLRITWDQDTVIEELHEICSGLTPEINQKFGRQHKHFWGVSVWQDNPGYSIDWHTDNPDIDVAIQIYLYDPSGMGTVFIVDDQECLISGEHNTGYLAHHSDLPRLLHRSQGAVPMDKLRYSIYAVWSRFPKKIADS